MITYVKSFKYLITVCRHNQKLDEDWDYQRNNNSADQEQQIKYSIHIGFQFETANGHSSIGAFDVLIWTNYACWYGPARRLRSSVRTHILTYISIILVYNERRKRIKEVILFLYNDIIIEKKDYNSFVWFHKNKKYICK